MDCVRIPKCQSIASDGIKDCSSCCGVHGGLHMLRILFAILIALTITVAPSQAGWKTKVVVAVGGYAAAKLTPMAIKACMKNQRCRTWAAKVGTDALESAIVAMGAQKAVECLASDTCGLGGEEPAVSVDEYIPAPPELKGFPGAKKGKSKTFTAAGKKRARWILPDGRIAEWDSQHGEVELYDKRGRHICAANPDTGECVKDRVPGRKVEP